MSGQEDKIGIGILGAAGIAKKNARGISLTRNGLGECREITSSIYKKVIYHVTSRLVQCLALSRIASC